MKNPITTTFFHILGIPYNATDAQVRSSYVVLAHRWHPDKHLGTSEQQQNHAAQQFRLVNRAYMHLKTKPQRDAYIRTLQKTFEHRRIEETSSSSYPSVKGKKASGLKLFGLLIFELLWPFVPQSGLGRDANLTASSMRNTMSTSEASYG